MHAEVAVALKQLLLVTQRLAPLPLVNCGLQFADRLRIAQRAHVAHVSPLHQRAHHPAHVLPAARLGELGHLDEVAWHRHGALLESHQLRQATLVVLRQRTARTRLHEGERCQPLFAMRCANHDHIAHRRLGIELTMSENRALDLLRSHAMARHIDHVVTATVQRERAVHVAHGKVALRVRPDALPARPVGVPPACDVTLPVRRDACAIHREMLAVAPHRAREVRVRRRDHDLALLFHHRPTECHTRAVISATEQRQRRLHVLVRRRGFRPHITDHPRHRIRVGIGAQRIVSVAVEVRPRNATMFCGPVRIDVPRGQQVHAELLHRGRCRLGAERAHAERRDVVAPDIHRILRVLHDAFQERHAGFEDADLMPLDDRRESTRVRKHRRPLGEHARHACCERR